MEKVAALRTGVETEPGIEVELAQALDALKIRVPAEVAQRILLSADLDAVA